MSTPNPNSLITKGTLLFVSTLTVMAGATIAPSLPEMQKHFAEVNNIEYLVRLILTIPALFIVVGAPIAGVMVDRVGRKPLLIVTTLLYAIAGTSGFFLNAVMPILLGRAFLGLAVAGIMTSVTTLIADYYQGPTRATFMGLQAAFMSFGGVVFLSVGGIIADLNWRMPFLIYSFALILLPFIVRSLFEPSPANSEAVTGINGEELQKTAFPVKLLSLIYGIAFLQMIVFYMIPVQLPFYLLNLTQATASQSGIAIAFSTLFSAFASMGYGRIKARLNFIPIIAIAFALVSIGYVIIGTAGSYAQVILGLAVAGLGLGLLMPNLNVWLTSQVPGMLRGRALGGLTTAFFLGQFLSPIVTQPISEQIGLGNTYTLAGGLLFILALIFFGITRFSSQFKVV